MKYSFWFFCSKWLENQLINCNFVIFSPIFRSLIEIRFFYWKPAFYLRLKKGEKKKKICHWQDSNPYPERWKNMTPLPARPRRLHTYNAYKTSTHLDGPKDFPICILKSFTFLELPFNYLLFGTIFIPCGFCFRLHCVLHQRALDMKVWSI